MVRCGIIGTGSVVEQMHLPALRALPDVEIRLACDLNAERLRALSAKYSIPRITTDFPMFVEEASDLDFIIVATPGFTHFEIVKKLIERGKHVFVEKPLTLCVEDAYKLSKLTRLRSVKVCVGHTWRYREPVLRAWEAFNNGLIGRIYQVNVTHHSGSLFHASEPPWRWEEKKHKVLLFEYAIHLLDLQVYFAGPVKQIVGIKVTDDPHLDAITNVYALIEHMSGATGILDVQAFSSSNYAHFELFGTVNDVQIKFFPHAYRIYSGRINPLDELYGDYLRMKDFAVPLLKGCFSKPRVPRRALPHYRLLKRFVQSITDESFPVPISIEDVLPTMDLLEQLSKLVYSGLTSEADSSEKILWHRFNREQTP